MYFIILKYVQKKSSLINTIVGVPIFIYTYFYETRKNVSNTICEIEIYNI